MRQLVKNPRGSILCFVGPPGVGKTSLAMSIGRATGRKFVRVSLGGVRDEAEIRGHRRTYIGALPGQIIQMMKKAGTVNPIFVLDEVDKMSTDFRGDPSAALMEVLDPELNHAFTDHYLDVEYDLSQGHVHLHRQRAAHDSAAAAGPHGNPAACRATPKPKKREIAKRFLVQKAARSRRPDAKTNITFTDEALTHIIRHYTHEAGVRSLEREIANICRKIARRVVKEGKQYSIEVTPENVNEFLGVIKYREVWAEKKNEIGLATGLAWTEVGGQVLSTEATHHAGQGTADADRQAGRRHAGIGAGGHELRALAHRELWPAARFLPPPRHSRARSRRRHPQGRPFGRNHHLPRPSSARSRAFRCAATWP